MNTILALTLLSFYFTAPGGVPLALALIAIFYGFALLIIWILDI